MEHTHTHTHTHTHAHTHIHTYTHTYTHTRAHTHTLTYTMTTSNLCSIKLHWLPVAEHIISNLTALSLFRGYAYGGDYATPGLFWHGT